MTLSHETQKAIDRVREYLEARSRMTGPVDRTEITSVWVQDKQYPLLVEDLERITDALEEIGWS